MLTSGRARESETDTDREAVIERDSERERRDRARESPILYQNNNMLPNLDDRPPNPDDMQ
jgi:hypothetical protein